MEIGEDCLMDGVRSILSCFTCWDIVGCSVYISPPSALPLSGTALVPYGPTPPLALTLTPPFPFPLVPLKPIFALPLIPMFAMPLLTLLLTLALTEVEEVRGERGSG